MLANRPPVALFQVQTFGGVYSDELLILQAPVVWPQPDPAARIAQANMMSDAAPCPARSSGKCVELGQPEHSVKREGNEVAVPMRACRCFYLPGYQPRLWVPPGRGWFVLIGYGF